MLRSAKPAPYLPFGASCTYARRSGTDDSPVATRYCSPNETFQHDMGKERRTPWSGFSRQHRDLGAVAWALFCWEDSLKARPVGVIPLGLLAFLSSGIYSAILVFIFAFSEWLVTGPGWARWKRLIVVATVRNIGILILYFMEPPRDRQPGFTAVILTGVVTFFASLPYAIVSTRFHRPNDPTSEQSEVSERGS